MSARMIGPHSVNASIVPTAPSEPTAPPLLITKGQPHQREGLLQPVLDSDISDWSRSPMGHPLDDKNILMGLQQAHPHLPGLHDLLDKTDSESHNIGNAASAAKIVILRGPHGSGKTASMLHVHTRCTTTVCESTNRGRARQIEQARSDWFAANPNKEPTHIRDFTERQIHERLRIGASGRKSFKFMIVSNGKNSIVELRKRLHTQHPNVNINAYFTASGVSPEMQIDGVHPVQTPDVSYRNSATRHFGIVKPVHGIIVDAATAITLLDTGAYIGSLIIDNVECYDDIPLLTSLMATAVSKMTRRTANGATNLGRMVIVTAETARDLKKGSKMWIDTIIDSATAGHRDLKPYSIYVPATGVPPSPRLIAIPCQSAMQVLKSAEPAAHAALDTVNLQPLTPGSPYEKTLNYAKRHTWATTNSQHDSELVARERVPGDRRDPRARMLSNTPDMGNARHELQSCARASMLSVLALSTANVRTATASTTVPKVLVIPSGPEQVSAIGRTLKDMPEFHLTRQGPGTDQRINPGDRPPRLPRSGRKTHYDEAFITHKMTFAEKYDTRINREPAVPIPPIVYGGNPNGAACFRGKLVIGTLPAIGTLRLQNVSSVVLTGAYLRPCRYRSNGLFVPINSFSDSHMIDQALSRLSSTIIGVPLLLPTMFFAATAFQLGKSLLTDDRTRRYESSYGMEAFLLEHCFTDSGNMKAVMFEPPEAISANIAQDAKILGCTSQRDNTMTQETAFLSNMLPQVDMRLKRLLVVSVAMGLSAHGAALVALEMCKGRVTQQAGIDPGHLGYETPAVDMFIKAIGLLPLGNLSADDEFPDEELRDCKSEKLVMADMWGSFSLAIFDPYGPEMTYADLMAGGKTAIHAPKRNFWEAQWTANPQFAFEDCFKQLRASAMRYGYDDDGSNLAFRHLYGVLVKDEGREIFCQCLREINSALVSAGLLSPALPKGILDQTVNRYILLDSGLLNKNGRSLLSGLIAMTHSNVGQLMAEDFAHKFPLRYMVYDDSNWEDKDGKLGPALVQGFSVMKPRGYGFSMYAPTDAKAGKPWEGRFHSIVHPVTAAHIAVMGNVFGSYNTEPATHVNGSDVPAKMNIDLTASPGIGKRMQFQLIGDDGAPANEEMVKKVLGMREYLKTALSASLKKLNTTQHEQYIIKCWNALSP